MRGNRKHLEAFQENYNTIGLAAVVALSAITLNPLPLLGAVIVEAAYLLFIPDSKWYDARLSRRYDQEVLDRRRKLAEQVYPTLNVETKSRFVRLEQVRGQIGDPTFQGKRWFQEVLRKLDYLLEKFLLFASKQTQFESYLTSVLEEGGHIESGKPPVKSRGSVDVAKPRDEAWVKSVVATIKERYEVEIEEIMHSMPDEANLHNQAVLDKRREILGRRKLYVEQIGEILINLGHQLRLIEDTFGLINDEIRARSPEQVLVDIDDVVYQSDNLSETLQEMSPFEQMPLAAGSGRLYDVNENRA